MNLSEEEILILKNRASSGAQLNDLQKVIQNLFGKQITYMETRFLISDLGIEILSEQEAPAQKSDEVIAEEPKEVSPSTKAGGVHVSVDQITRPGVMVSGQVVWSDGVRSQWYLDQTGQLGLDSDSPTYQPNQEDINAFQTQLREVLGA